MLSWNDTFTEKDLNTVVIYFESRKTRAKIWKKIILTHAQNTRGST